MKIFPVFLSVVAVASAIPYSGEYVDEVFLAGGGSQQGFDSQSVESSEVSLAGGDWKQAALDRINELRMQVGQKALALDSKLSKTAQEWAGHIKCSGGVHSPSIPNQAENLAGLLKGKPESERAVDGVNSWYSEVKDYDCRSFVLRDQSYYLKIGHYFNMMSKQFSAVGFGMEMCSNNGRGWLVAQFAGPDGYAATVFGEELTNQGLGFANYMNIDMSGFVTCPNSA